MNNSKKISVLMPVYNTKEEFLRTAIESILNQTYSNFEFIIINDGSTNNAEDVILSYKDERIVYLKQENKGIVSALNNGWDKASGEYIARMDSDDISLSERFEKQIEFLENNSEYSLVGTAVEVIPKGFIIKSPTDVKLMDLLADCPFIQPSIMFRKSDFDKYNLRYLDNFNVAEDYMLYAKAIRYLKMTNIPNILLKYRIHSKNTTSTKKDEVVKNSFIVQDLILDYMSSNPEERKKLLDLAYKNKAKRNNITEKIFSLKNLYKNWTKYKLITILGCEFYLKSKTYVKNNPV